MPNGTWSPTFPSGPRAVAVRRHATSAGSRSMPSSRCGTGHASSGESAWAAQPNRARRLSTRSPTLPHRRVANAAMTPATEQGRKRHIAVDTLGLLPAMTVTTDSVQDRDGAVDVVAQACRQGSRHRTAPDRWCVRRAVRRSDRADPRNPGRARIPRVAGVPVLLHDPCLDVTPTSTFDIETACTGIVERQGKSKALEGLRQAAYDVIGSRATSRQPAWRPMTRLFALPDR